LRVPVQKWFATLTGQLQPGSIKVTGGVVGAGVWLDGVRAGLLGADGLTIIGVTPGPHQIAVTKAGYEKFERTVTVTTGAAEKLAVQLKATEGGEAIEPAPVQPGASTLTAAPTESEGSLPPGRMGFRAAAWAAVGVGLALVGFGVYSSYVVSDVNSKLDPLRRYPCTSDGALACKADGTTRPGDLTPDDVAYIKSEQDTGDTYSKLQWVGYGVGGVFLIGSAVFFYHGYLAQPSNASASQPRSNLIVMPTFGPGSAGAMAYLTF
jgi:hypothetical protein